MQSIIRKVSFKAGLPLEIEVIPIAATVSRHKEAIGTPHRVEFYYVLWVQKGTAEYFIDFEPVKVEENSFLFVSKDRVQALSQVSQHDGKILLFTDSFFTKSDADTKYLHSTLFFNDLLDIPILDVAALPSLQSIFLEIEAELARGNDAYQADIAHSLLRGLLFMAERERKMQGVAETTKGADFDYTVLFKDLVAAHFRKLKAVNGYAAQMSVSVKRLSVATTKTVGRSPKTIIDERVILEAKRLLIYTSSSIKEIGFELGFEDPTYFIKYFRKHANKNPIEFRDSHMSR